MTRLLARVLACASALLLFSACSAVPTSCDNPGGVTLQVLGSGGPIADDARASTGYLIWLDGHARVMVDTGGGTAVRFGEAGAQFTSLDHIALSHFHTDHSADLVSILKSGNFAGRTRALSLSGPAGSGPFPALDNYLQSLLGAGGAYAYLGGYLTGTNGLPQLDTVQVDHTRALPTVVYVDAARDIKIDALGVPHGIVPALAYRVTIGGRRLVFASDQNGNDEAFIDFARDADVLVMHMVVPEDVAGIGRKLHAPPSRIGEIARAADVKTLLLSHFMARSLRDFDGNIALIAQQFDGGLVAASDLLCVPVATTR